MFLRPIRGSKKCIVISHRKGQDKVVTSSFWLFWDRIKRYCNAHDVPSTLQIPASRQLLGATLDCMWYTIPSLSLPFSCQYYRLHSITTDHPIYCPIRHPRNDTRTNSYTYGCGWCISYFNSHTLNHSYRKSYAIYRKINLTLEQ